MPLKSWLARFLITRAARAYGFLDPVSLLAKMRGFSQPSEVGEPVELLRAGMIFHARGLINTKAIQNNLDWIWPYWVERQFNPMDESFIPRAFSFSHINLTHRNWTAVGLPDVPYYPIVDPRGLVTPLFDGWSLDFWYVDEKGGVHAPSKLASLEQELRLQPNPQVHSVAEFGGVTLTTDVEMCLDDGHPKCCVDVGISPGAKGWVAVALRPYNPEGVSFIDTLAPSTDGQGFVVNGRHPVLFDRKPGRFALSVYEEGDVCQRLLNAIEVGSVAECAVGMATGAALFDAAEVAGNPLRVRVPIYDELKMSVQPKITPAAGWEHEKALTAKLRINDECVQRLYDQAVTNVILHTGIEVYPGPYTYKRFWFRDAVFILNALLALGSVERVRRAMVGFTPRQRRDGYFLSQEGEWDSNGEALWMYRRFAQLTGETLPDDWLEAVKRGARWIGRKRLPADLGRPEAGLLPAGFSAEHLGPNDFYYWDDFWGVAGLRSAAALLLPVDAKLSASFTREADDFLATIQRSIPAGPHRRFPGAIPASPKRRMDAGAIGSIVADYPLQLFAPGDPRILLTADYLRDHSSFNGGFFQNMIHSGINPYLTLHLAQVRLRAGQAHEAWDLMKRVAQLASPTGQWPEAIHPRTLGGCMGDGQHIWAAAEWTYLVRNCFVREEVGGLVIGSGVRPEWWHGTGASFGPTLTPYGAVTVHIQPAAEGGASVIVDGDWRGQAPHLDLNFPGYVAPSSAVTAGQEQRLTRAA
jgi:hypothetical protein